jgi:CheY-like chemotaxis protein
MENKRKNRILLVSHNLALQDSLGQVLKSNGFEVLAVESGRQAVEVLAANAMSVVVLDYETPFILPGSWNQSSRTLEELTDMDAFLPLVLICAPDVEPERTGMLIADIVLRQPVDELALLDAIETLLSETLKERVFRKSGHVAVLR